VVPAALLAWVALMSALAFALMAMDKARARRGGWRVRERDLLLAAAAGGSPGTLAAMLILAHKTRKLRFLGAFANIVLLQAALAWAYLR
jgi:uncharacterized membrane protein YsdA (DUF1294 family)